MNKFKNYSKRPLWRHIIQLFLPTPGRKYGYCSWPKWFWRLIQKFRFKFKPND